MRSQYAKRVDRSQPKIVSAMRDFAQVEITNMGNDFPDLMCGFAHKWKLVEVKELDGCFSRGQLEFLSRAVGPVDIVISESDGIKSIRADRYLAPYQRGAIDSWLIKNPNQETIRVKKLLGIIGREIDKPGTNGSES